MATFQSWKHGVFQQHPSHSALRRPLVKLLSERKEVLVKTMMVVTLLLVIMMALTRVSSSLACVTAQNSSIWVALIIHRDKYLWTSVPGILILHLHHYSCRSLLIANTCLLRLTKACMSCYVWAQILECVHWQHIRQANLGSRVCVGTPLDAISTATATPSMPSTSTLWCRSG